MRACWTSDDTLYLEAGTQDLGDENNTKVVATLAGAKEVEQFPPEVNSAFQQEVRRRADSFEIVKARPCTSMVGRNDQFVVTVEEPPDAPNCQGVSQLTMARSDGTNAQQIAEDLPREALAEDMVFFDTESSIVLYSNPGDLFSGAIIALDLKTRKRQAVALPYDYELRLLDRTKDGVVAYTVKGPCVPDDSFEQTLVQWAEPTNVNFRRQFSPVPHVCFVKFP